MKFFKWFIGLSNTVKAISAVISFVVLLTVGALNLKSKIETRAVESFQSEEIKKAKETELTEILVKVSTIENKVDGLNTSVRQLAENQETTNESLSEQKNILNNMKKSMLEKASTKEEVLEILKMWNEDEIKKKEGSGLSWIPPMLLNTETQRSLK